ncbi:MAG TPA: chorismate synthase [Chitinophagales bacterium]|nr:chorismate synthase [Chitinophagales bacterium]
MPGNSIGQFFRITTFGESHGPAIGVVIDGCPAGLKVDLDIIRQELDRRRPGQSKITTTRRESDEVEILSGIFEGKTLGTPIMLLIKNTGQRSQDYEKMKDVYRPSHADFTYQEKYGIRDYRGGGRSSARETAARVASGAIAKLLLREVGVEIKGYVSAVGNLSLKKEYTELNLDEAEKNIVRCPDKKTAEEMIALIEKVRKEGDTLGGIVSCVVRNCPVGLGEPVFDKLHADLAKAMLSINATKGFEYGSGFEGVKLRGSEHNDMFEKKGNKIITKTNHSGGIQGGISNGMDIYFRVAFKPVATIMQEQESVSVTGERAIMKGQGRHDPCVLPRAVPIVEAMTALVLADHLLRSRVSKLSTFKR